LLLGQKFECKVVVFDGDARGGWCWLLVVMLVVAGAGFWCGVMMVFVVFNGRWFLWCLMLVLVMLMLVFVVVLVVAVFLWVFFYQFVIDGLSQILGC
jgi:hypothetical protein